MSNGFFVLKGKQGHEISFDPAGRFSRARARVVKGMSWGDYRVEFDYEFNTQQPRIRQAQVMKKE